MLILGIESSCDETAAAVVEIGHGKINVISNIVSSQIKIHKKYGGVVPEVAARKHAEVVFDVIKKALGKYSIDDIDLIAVTEGPGLVTSLRVGVLAAETLAVLAKKTLVGVNHIEAHLLSALLTPSNSPLEKGERGVFPALGLIVSGGHTELILVKDSRLDSRKSRLVGKYKIIGTTRDDAVGEAFDKVAKILNLGYPGGPAIAREAAKILHNAPSPRFAVEAGQPPLTLRGGEEIKLPRPMINSDDFDFSFSGLKTAVLYLAKKMTAAELKKNTSAIAAEFQQAAIDVLVHKTKRAAEKYRVKNILVGGGVIANKELRDALGKLDFQVYLPELKYTGDNAAMIASAGYHKYMRTKKNEVFDIAAEPNLSI